MEMKTWDSLLRNYYKPQDSSNTGVSQDQRPLMTAAQVAGPTPQKPGLIECFFLMVPRLMPAYSLHALLQPLSDASLEGLSVSSDFSQALNM